MTYNDICALLRQRYDDGEARAVARYLLEVGCNMPLTDILSGGTERLPEDELKEKIGRLVAGEPVQYVVGTAEFCHRRFHVAPGVLIPRPETEDLCRLITTAHRPPLTTRRSILDIGTGSGCIAITLALDLPDTDVEAWDISPEALKIAGQNAEKHGANVAFGNVDILTAPALGQWDIIVSNPPYIVPSESEGMEEHVLRHEPGIALFAPEDNPLLFYRAIAGYAARTLTPEGKLFFEINPLFATQLEALLGETGFSDIAIINDRFGRKRFATATNTEI
ncbi:MAG: peptide chain release factor N(5)-glutamine methyltransferase [Prevotella sp.]|uniref:peptide chain release factor N(5)-glutamine methyltransferase n=1 Tax=Prevotella sp. TaxID=59823 RepID=UPI002A2ED57A|nr:peptide chain release factor N(5)-glutamine methyltransferase [Prevotella sp.]MDD7317309.1 peptide chain release factor N(5)-glutamine methyltransferase [Prevotellaceae bacterium]MDY4019913.1 peptide chain release factor N(5)-glutamine methyltransferase [Prevotella sp.]